jgi:hypothetical protein
MQQPIEVGFRVFVAEGEDGAGAVRALKPDEDAVVVNIENGGDFTLPLSAIRDVHDDKVILELSQLPAEMCRAFDHLHDAEYREYAAVDPDEGAPGNQS